MLKWWRAARKDPVVFAEQALLMNGVDNPRLTGQQLELITAVAKETFLPMDDRLKRIAVKSGQGTGKTTCEVVLALWRVFLEEGNLVVITAPTMAQVKDVWIAEARRVIGKSHPIIKNFCYPTATKIDIGSKKRKDDDPWQILGKASSRPENFQGFHGKQLTIIVDEASGVDREIFEMLKGTVTNRDSLMVCAGNPNYRDSAFFDMFHKPSERDNWHKFTFNSEDSPLTDKVNIDRIGQEFGMESDTYRIRVLGEFPLQNPNCVMSSYDLMACSGDSAHKMECARMRTLQQLDKVISIDVARFGGDESIIYRRSGLAVVEFKRFAKKEPLDVLDYAIDMQRRAGWRDKDCMYVLDSVGMGGGLPAVLYRAGKRVHEFHTQHRASQPDYANKMTEAYFHVGKLAKARRIYIPDDEHLINQLCGRLYETDPKGKLILEKKDDYMKRNGMVSPDRADSLAMCFYDAVRARGQVA